MSLNIIKLFSGRNKKKPQAGTDAKAQRQKSKSNDNAQKLFEDDYQIITEKITKAGKKRQCFLFAACNSAAMPITIPVNVAIQLANGGKKCLLIDMDLRRDALTQAFEISHEQQLAPRPKAVKTSFENLLIWPARNFSDLCQMNLRSIVESAKEKMDFVLINAPTITSSVDRNLIAKTAQCCILFSSNLNEANKLKSLAKDRQCDIIGNMRLTFRKEPPSNAGTVEADWPKTTV